MSASVAVEMKLSVTSTVAHHSITDGVRTVSRMTSTAQEVNYVFEFVRRDVFVSSEPYIAE